MKKRLFLTSAVMAGVLSVALTTGTFAWYQATNGGVKLGSQTGGNVTHTATVYEKVIADDTIDNLLTISVTQNAIANSGKLELAHYATEISAGAGNHNLVTAYADGNDGLHEVANPLGGENNVLFVTVTITVSLNTGAKTGDYYVSASGIRYTEAEVLAGLNGQQLVCSIAPDGSSRARAFTSDAASGDPTTAVEVTISLAGLTASNTKTGTFFAYVLGDADDYDSTGNLAAQQLNVTCTAQDLPTEP